MKNKKNSSLYLLCSPNIGLLDNWLPVVHKLKKYNPNLDCHLIFTTVEATMSINFDNAVISISSDIFDSTIFRTSTGLFVRTKSLESAKSICSVGSLLSRVLRYNSAGKKNIFLKKLTYIFFVIYRFIEFFRYKNNIVKFNSIIAGNDILLYDVHVQNFNFERSVIALFIYKFSMPHGIDISKNQNKKMVKNKDFDLNLTVYLFSNLQYSKYINKYGINEGNITVCGIPRHESEWVSIIKNNSNKINLPFKNYETVVIFSSPYTESNSYLPINKKQEIIKDIKKTVIDILGMKVVIKIHPKEGLEGVYEEVFGLDQYGSTWVYSDLHQFALAADKKLAITMWSGVCFDMIKIGVPCIEYVDLRTVKGFNDYDKNGEKVSPFVYFGLAIGVRNHNEFLCQVKKILKMADGGSAVPIDNYERYIVSNNDASSKIALDILSKTA